MNLKDAFQAAQNGQVIARLTAAIWKAATDIVNEDTQTAQHAARLDWAKRALVVDGKAQSYAFIISRLAFSENTTLQNAWSPQTYDEAITDGDLQFVVNGYVPKLVAAGV